MSEDKAAFGNTAGVRPPEAEHTFALRTLNTVEKPDFDGPSKPAEIIDQVYRIEREGGRLAPDGLGNMAGAAVLAQYRAAKAEVSARWWQLGPQMIGSGLLTFAVPVVALMAGGAIDVAIFGGAADALMKDNPWFMALAGGSLVFAAGVGLSKSREAKAIMGGLLLTASVGASMLAADNPNFKGHFANMLPSSLRSEIYTANNGLAEAQALVKIAEEKLERDLDTLQKGGVGGYPIFGDGYKGNDDQGLKLQNETIPEDERVLSKARADNARAESSQNVANAESPASWWGQIIGAVYLSAWLIASQLVVAKVIDSAASTFKEARKEAAQRRANELFVHGLESARREPAARVAVSDIVHRFRDAMTNACKNNPVQPDVTTRLLEIDKLFSGENLVNAIETGAKVVKDSVHPHRETFEEQEKNQEGLIRTVLSMAERRKGASSGKKSDNNIPAP